MHWALYLRRYISTTLGWNSVPATRLARQIKSVWSAKTFTHLERRHLRQIHATSGANTSNGFLIGGN